MNANQHTSDSETNEAISRNTKEEFVAEHWRRLGGYRAGEQNPHPSVKVHAAGGHCLPAHILLLSHESNRATAGQLIQAAPPKGKSGFCPSTPMRLCLHCWKECLPKHRCTCGQGRCKYQYFAGFGLLPQKNVIFEFVAFTLFDAFLSKHWNSMFSESWPQNHCKTHHVAESVANSRVFATLAFLVVAKLGKTMFLARFLAPTLRKHRK